MQWGKKGVLGHTQTETLQRKRAASLDATDQSRAVTIGDGGRTGNAVGIARIVSCDGIEEDRTILGTASDGSHVIKRPAQRDDAVATDAAIGWFEPGHAAASRGDANGAAS